MFGLPGFCFDRYIKKIEPGSPESRVVHCGGEGVVNVLSQDGEIGIQCLCLKVQYFCPTKFQKATTTVAMAVAMARLRLGWPGMTAWSKVVVRVFRTMPTTATAKNFRNCTLRCSFPRMRSEERRVG